MSTGSRAGRSVGSSAAMPAGRAYRDARPCRDRRASALSTTRPAYMMTTRSQKCRTRLRSWLMKISPRPRLRDRARRAGPGLSSRTVTSSAEVGSSAISTSGPAISIMAIIDPLAHAAGDLVRVKAWPHARGSRIFTASSMIERSRAVASCSGSPSDDAGGRSRRSVRRSAMTGIERIFRVLQDQADPPAAQIVIIVLLARLRADRCRETRAARQ